MCREVSDMLAANGYGLAMWWNLKIVRLEPLLIKDIKVQVNKQKFSYVCPAQMKLIAIKCSLLQRPATILPNRLLVAGQK